MEARLWAQKKYALISKILIHPGSPGLDGKDLKTVFGNPMKKPDFRPALAAIRVARKERIQAMGMNPHAWKHHFIAYWDKTKHGGKQTSAAYIAADLLQKYGINAYEASRGLAYIMALQRMGELGYGKKIHCDT